MLRIPFLLLLCLSLSQHVHVDAFTPIHLTTPAKRTNKQIRNFADPLKIPTIPHGGQNTNKLRSALSKNYFLVGMLTSIVLASQFPSAGAILAPSLSTYGVKTIFLLTGITLKTDAIKQALFKDYKLNSLIMFMTYVAWPGLVLLMSSFLNIPEALRNGLFITASLPTTINMCVILTTESNGNIASSLANAVLSNGAGIFLTPLLILWKVGKTAKIDVQSSIVRLSSKVLLPVLIGQLLRSSGAVEKFVTANKKYCKLISESVLIGIVFTSFCDSFGANGIFRGTGMFEVLPVLLLLMPALHLVSFFGSFAMFKKIFKDKNRKTVVSSSFVTSHKTLAFGLPIIKTLFEGDKNLPLYSAPIMFLHPVQLLVGSLLTTRMKKWSEEE